VKERPWAAAYLAVMFRAYISRWGRALFPSLVLVWQIVSLLST
jgi:hypothetical protein